MVKTGDNDYYLSDGTFRLVTKKNTFKNVSFNKFQGVEVTELDELSGNVNTVIYQSGTSLKGRPVIQIRSIILNN